MCSDIMENVAGEVFSAEKGILHNYQRYLVKNETYPALVSENGRQVEGIVYLGINKSTWDRLDTFEGDIYAKQAVNILVDNSKMIRAITYVLKPEFNHFITDIIWEYEKFLKNGKKCFVNYYNGFKLI